VQTPVEHDAPAPAFTQLKSEHVRQSPHWPTPVHWGAKQAPLPLQSMPPPQRPA
jgi:hypothetical protein